MTFGFKQIEDEFAEIAKIQALSFDKSWSETMLKDMFCNEQYSGSVVFKAEQMLGFVICSTVLDETEIISIAISPKYRGKALAYKLLEYEIERLQKLMIKKIFLEVNEHNQKAIQLYKSWDFKTISKRKNYYKLSNGKHADGLVFALDI